MVQTLMVVVRKVFGLQDYVTIGHIEAMNKVIVLTGSIVGIAYLTELFMAGTIAKVNMKDMHSSIVVQTYLALMVGVIGV
jgi:hypothetical protein